MTEPQIDLSSLPELSPEELAKKIRELPIEYYSPPKQIFNISLKEFKSLVDAQVDITALYLLECISNKIDLGAEFPNSSKVKAWIQTLQRRGYITDMGDVSETGKLLLEMVAGGKEIKKELTKIEDKQEDGFEKWWAAFPSNDIFTFKGRKFNGSRSLKSDKSKCRAYFDKIINEGEYTVDDMIRALNYEVHLKKEASFQQGVNKLSYLSGSAPYLNQRKFEAFMDASKNVPIVESKDTQYSGFDI